MFHRMLFPLPEPKLQLLGPFGDRSAPSMAVRLPPFTPIMGLYIDSELTILSSDSERDFDLRHPRLS